MNLGITQEDDKFFFHIETLDQVNLQFNAETGKHEITIGPFSKEKFTSYTGLDKLPEAQIEVKAEEPKSPYAINTTPVETGTLIEPSTQKPMSDLVQKDPLPKTSAPLLDWDMEEVEVVPTPPSNPEIFEKAAAAIKNIDTTEAEKELAAQAQAAVENKATSPVTPQPSVAFKPKSFEDFQQQALDNIKALDKQLAEGGRVNVADKYILNCQADLNQLVPFKYGWAWSDYLNACDKHWMPPEYNLEASAKAFNDGTFSPEHKALLTKAWYTDQYHQMLLPIQTVLNAYRLITNPECRQYTLRQAFELSLKKHAWLHLSETLVGEGQTFASHVVDDKGTKSLKSLMKADECFRDRYTLVKENLTNISGETFTTAGIDNVRTFVFEMIVGFGYVNYIMLLPAYYQVMDLARKGVPSEGINRLFEMMVKDVKAQSDNLKRLIPTILEENPGVMNQELHDKIVKFFKQATDIELDIISYVSPSEIASLTALIYTETNNLLSAFGVTMPEKRIPQNADHTWFMKLLEKHSPAVHSATSVTGTGGSLEF